MNKIISLIMSPAKFTAVAFIVLLVLTSSLNARAEDVCEGNGYKLEIGSGFQVQRKDADICSYRSGEDAVILLKDWPGLSREAIEDFVNRGYQTENISLARHGEIRQVSAAGGAGYLVRVAGSVRNRAVEGIAGGFVGEDGQGVSLLISSVVDKWDEIEKRANAVIESIKFTSFENRIGAQEWRQMLSGTGLSYREISEHGDKQENYYFCSDGRFYSGSSQSEHATGDGDMMFNFSNSKDSGEWDMRMVQGKTQLVLYYNSGRENWANIEDRDGETWIDDTRYYMIENGHCR